MSGVLNSMLSSVARGPGRAPTWLVPAALLAVSVLSVGAVVYGRYFADPDIRVFDFDAGPVAGLEVGGVRPFPELDMYLVGLEDGRVRALDGRVRSSGCAVEWHPEDVRPAAANPRGAPGAFIDPCTGAVWAVNGNQVRSAGDPEPLRTFDLLYATQPDGQQHVFVTVIGRDAPGAERGGE